MKQKLWHILECNNDNTKRIYCFLSYFYYRDFLVYLLLLFSLVCWFSLYMYNVHTILFFILSALVNRIAFFPYFFFFWVHCFCCCSIIFYFLLLLYCFLIFILTLSQHYVIIHKHFECSYFHAKQMFIPCNTDPTMADTLKSFILVIYNHLLEQWVKCYCNNLMCMCVVIW